MSNTRLVQHQKGKRVSSFKKWDLLCRTDDHIECSICIYISNRLNSMNKYDKRWKMWGGNDWTGNNAGEVSQVLTSFLAFTASIVRTTTFRTPTTSSLQERVEFELRTCLAYVFTSNWTYCSKQYLSISHATKQGNCRVIKNSFAVPKAPPNTYTKSPPGFESLQVDPVHAFLFRTKQMALPPSLALYEHHLLFR